MISVIIPLFNKEKAIEATLLSVLNQTYKDFELIIADDGSTDGSSSIVKEYVKKDNRIKYFRKSNGGVSSARNYGLSQATGEWVVFLDADDEMLPDNLEHLLSLVTDCRVKIASANVLVRHKDGTTTENKLRITQTCVFSNFIKAIIRHQASFASGATIYTRHLLGEKPYNEKLSRYEDADFELSLFVKGSIVMSVKPVMIHHNEYAELSRLRVGDTEKDYIFSMDFRNKTFWQKVKMGQYVNEGCYSYQNGKQQMKSIYGMNYYWRYAYKAISKFYGGLYKITR